MNDMKDSHRFGDYFIRVLLVDDQPMIGEAVRRALSGPANIAFHYCADPTEAARVAQNIKPTVILQDLVMPGVDGLSLVRQYRAQAATHDVPIVVLSTKEEPAVKSAAFAAGANDYLVKLPDAVELVARVQHHSKAYLNQVQRDEAFRALRESQQQLMQANIELRRLTNLDGLTGLSNRRYFNEHMEAEWKRALWDRALLAVLMIDVDHFKPYNDTYGHVAGDEVLKKVAEAIRACLKRPSDLAARFGGEEFALILPATDLAGADGLAECVRRSVEELKIPHQASATAQYVTLSVGGAAMVPRPTATPLHLIKAADEALYRAKKAGRNRSMSGGVTVADLGSPG